MHRVWVTPRRVTTGQIHHLPSRVGLAHRVVARRRRRANDRG